MSPVEETRPFGEGGADTEHVEEIAGDLAPEHDGRLAVGKQDALVEPIVVRRHAGKALRRILPVEVIGRGHLRFVPSPLRVLLPDRHQSVGLPKRKTAQQHGVEHREHRDGGSDSKGEGDHGEETERGLALETAGRDSNVMEQNTQDPFSFAPAAVALHEALPRGRSH
jgi:hypothetical protein